MSAWTDIHALNDRAASLADAMGESWGTMEIERREWWRELARVVNLIVEEVAKRRR